MIKEKNIQLFFTDIRVNRFQMLIMLFFAITYALISLVNHYCFRTYALDLGAYTNAMYDYIHFQWNDCSVFREIPENLLADHFDLYLIIFSPFLFLFGTYTLLVIQIIAILCGGWGIHQYILLLTTNKKSAIAAMTMFYLFFGIYSSLAFDYHSNVVASALVPWFFYYFRKNNFSISFLMLILICIAKENMSLWMIFIIIGLLFDNKNFRQPKLRNVLLIFIIFSILYFVIVTNYIMPALARGGKNIQLNNWYSYFGNNISEIARYMIQHPLEVLKDVFINHTNNPRGNYVKLEFHILILLSGLWTLLFKPQYIIMLIPLYFQKMLSNNYLMWGIDTQYSVEFAAILVMGAFSFLYSLKNIKLQKGLMYFLLVTTLASTIRIMDNTILFTNKARIRIYQERHYKRDYDISRAYKVLNNLPKDAAISAQSPFVPHLALRKKIYQYPIVKDAEYIVLCTKEEYFPLDSSEFHTKLQQLEESNQFRVLIKDSDFIVFQRVRKIE